MIKEINGRFTCADCGYEYSAMASDDEIPNFCESCQDVLYNLEMDRIQRELSDDS